MVRTIQIGRFHQLRVARHVDGGVMLGAADRELFLPSHLLPGEVEVGRQIEVFVYADRDGQPQATTRVPDAVLGEFACLPCVAVTSAGAYLGWGVPKDLYVPPKEQDVPLVEGRRYVAVVSLDKKGERLVGSTRLSKHFDYDVGEVEPGDEVDLLVYGETDAGVQVVVDQRHRGLIHRRDVHRELPVGTELRGWVDKVRHDHRLDIVLTRRGVEGIPDAERIVLAALEHAGGALPLHDRSPPEEIERALGLSKKAFKRAAGGLYKRRRITIDEHGIRLVDPPAGDEP